MTTTEDAMHTLPTGKPLIVVNVALQANLAEGQGRSGKNRMYFYRVAYGSANGVAVHLRLPAIAGAVDPAGVEGILEQFDQVRAMT